MWDVLVRTPRGSNNPRKFSLLLTMFFMACFAYIFASAPSVYAANATWEGDNIVYNNATYTPLQSSDSLPSDVKASPAIYQYIDDSQNPDLVYFIYFADDVRIAKSAKEATYIRYTLNPPNDDYINPTDKQTIALTPVEAGETAYTEDGTVLNTCTIDSIGWLVCPLMNGIAEGMDFIFNRIRAFLEVQPITTSVDNPIYRIWSYSRDLANIAFVLGFMVIIYSYLVGGGFNGYEIRKILPRLVMAAILINISYVICAAAVDISNIAGYGVNQLFENVRDEVLPGSQVGSTNWTSVTAWVLAGGAGAVAGAAILPGAIGGAVGGLWFMLAPFLLGAALLVMVTFLILAARQAIIIILIAIAPLAFAAFILPNTEKWFERWRSLFFTMLVMFPAFGAVFGGAQLAGEVIIRTATNIEQIILGLGVMVAPLAITPLLLKLGGGILNRFGGIINNPRKGVYDRYKNYNRDRLSEHVAKNNATNAALLAGGGFKRKQFMRRRAANDFAKKNFRDEQKKRDEESAVNSWHRQTGRWGYDNHQDRDSVQNRLTRRPQNGYGNLDTYKRDNQQSHDLTESRHEQHWQDLLKSDSTRRAIQTETRLNTGLAKIDEEEMNEADTSFLNQSIANGATPRYAAARNAKIRTAVQKGLGENAAKIVDAEGSAQLAEVVLNNNALKEQIIKTHEFQGRASQANELVEDAAKAKWQTTTLKDQTVYTRQLERQANAKNLKSLQDEWESILVEASAGRTDDYQRRHGRVTTQVTDQIDIIRRAEEASEVEEKRKANATYVVKSNLTKRLKSDGALLDRAAGIDEFGRTKVVAQLYKEGSALHMQNVEAVESTFSNEGYQPEELIKVYQRGELRRGEPATEMHIHAAIKQLASEKANNTAMQKMSDHIASQGMEFVNGNYYDISDTGHNNALDEDEVERRRNLQQIFADAMAKTGHQITHLSGTDKANLQTGTYTAGTTTAIIRDIAAGKIKADRVGKMDIDEMVRSLQVFRDNPADLNNINPDNRKAYVDVIDEAMKDPIIGAKLETRHRRALEAMKLYLDPTTPIPAQTQVEAVAGRRIPDQYDPLTMAD